MLTQAIKRWLSRMFAWWPWKHTPVSGPTYTTSNINQGMMPDILWFPPADGPAPQPGSMSIAVDQERKEVHESPQPPGGKRSIPDDRAEYPIQQSSAAEENTTLYPHATSATAKQDEPPTISPGEATPEQRMAFLRYLVKHRHVNEGFAEDKIPEQYKRH